MKSRDRRALDFIRMILSFSSSPDFSTKNVRICDKCVSIWCHGGDHSKWSNFIMFKQPMFIINQRVCQQKRLMFSPCFDKSGVATTCYDEDIFRFGCGCCCCCSSTAWEKLPEKAKHMGSWDVLRMDIFLFLLPFTSATVHNFHWRFGRRCCAAAWQPDSFGSCALLCPWQRPSLNRAGYPWHLPSRSSVARWRRNYEWRGGDHGTKIEKVQGSWNRWRLFHVNLVVLVVGCPGPFTRFVQSWDFSRWWLFMIEVG